MALVWVMLAAAVFLAFYPVLKEQASYYYTDQLKSDQLLRQMYHGKRERITDIMWKRKEPRAH